MAVGTMTEEARQARINYQRAWRAKNKDKCRQYKLNYWEKKARQAQESQETETN